MLLFEFFNARYNSEITNVISKQRKPNVVQCLNNACSLSTKPKAVLWCQSYSSTDKASAANVLKVETIGWRTQPTLSSEYLVVEDGRFYYISLTV